VRDDFSKATIERLAKRAGYLCSNPHCRLPTIGAALSHEGVVNIGLAAHITAAAPGGPRYDASLTPEQRRHESNGLWLCQTDGKLVDSDEGHFTVAMLREWKTQAEKSSFRAILSGQNSSVDASQKPSSDRSIESLLQRIRGAAVADLAGFKRAPSWPRHAIALNLRAATGGTERQFNAETVGALLSAFNELIVVAPPGTGKTTTLIQIDEAILAHGHSVAVFVPLGEWALQARSLFESLALRRALELTATVQDLKLLAESGRLILTLDGWNELDDAARTLTAKEIQRLKREFPDVGIVISTRRQAVDVPIAAPIVHIDTLSEQQQLELSKALAGARGEAFLDHAWRTPGVRELVAIPLYLTALVTRTDDGPFPTTREEIIRLFIDEHERNTERGDDLRRVAFGLHPEILTTLAVEATRASNTTISEARARPTVAHSVANLLESGQLTIQLQPTRVLDGLISHHLLVKSSSGVAFQHQQFQEWYASHEAERVMIRATRGEHGGREVLRPEVLNKRQWEEPILFACERLSRRDSTSAQAVVSAILEASKIDPMLAAQMIYRSSDTVWDQIKDVVIQFALRWHVDGEVDRAAAFMITTGRGEFGPQIWPLVANQDDQVSYRALRCAGRFRPSVLGSHVRERIASLSEEVRKVVLHEIAFYSGMDGMELATDVARSDSSAVVQIAVVEALLFRRADRLAAIVLRQASDEVWRAIASKGYYVARLSEPDVAGRLQKERDASITSEDEPLRKLALLLEDAANGADVALQISSLIQEPGFPARDDYGGLGRAYQLYPSDVTSALVRRIEAGREVPYWALDALRAANIGKDDGPAGDLVLRPETPRAVANAAAIVAGPKTIGRLIDEMIPLNEALRRMSRPIDEDVRQRFVRLEELVANASDSSLAHALIGRELAAPVEIALLAEQLARHNSRGDRAPLRTADDTRDELTKLISRWVDALISSAETEDRQFADVARAIGRVAAPELATPLRRLLEEDRVRGRDSRVAHSLSLERHGLERADAYISWANPYREAFAAIGDGAVAEVMMGQSPEYASAVSRHRAFASRTSHHVPRPPSD
jgi:hypothetical protein